METGGALSATNTADVGPVTGPDLPLRERMRDIPLVQKLQRHPQAVTLSHIRARCPAADRERGPPRRRPDGCERADPWDRLRARRDRADPGLRHPQARQLRPRRLHHPRRLRGLRGQRQRGPAADRGLLAALAAVAALGVLLECTVWGPMRARRRRDAAPAAVDRAGLRDPQPDPLRLGHREPLARRQHDRSRSSSLGLRIGQTRSWSSLAGPSCWSRSALMLRYTLIGKTMRALSDSFDLAEVRASTRAAWCIYTWLLAGSLAGLAGVLAAIYTSLDPQHRLGSAAADLRRGGPRRDRQRLRGADRRGHARPGAGVVDDDHRPALQGGGRLPRADPGAAVRPQGIFGQARTI